MPNDDELPAVDVPDSQKPSPTVVRSAVPSLPKYPEYKQYLRYDFWYSCAYCTITEAEAQAISFTIDHYEPQGAREDLVNIYSNLMYCCEACNRRKGNRNPPPEAREAGLRFFRPDHDIHSEHFELDGLYLAAKTSVATYTIEAIDLNRTAVRRLREIRERLVRNSEYIASGIAGLRQVRIDQLPPAVRAKVHLFRTRLEKAVDQFEGEIDSLLREHAKSGLIDQPEDERQQESRYEVLEKMQALFPGTWRASRNDK